jgi:hypoxanthine phosphoribosyltransferase
VTAVVAEAPTMDHPTGGQTRRRTALPVEGARFAHASEAELARILDFYMVRWEYEPRTFPILWNLDGQVIESFSPDFYLPDLDMWLELTTLRQSLVRRKNRKLRRMRELYPMIKIKLLYARDFRALMLKYGRLDVAASLIGADGQVVPGSVVTDADRSRADVARSTHPSAEADRITIA